MSFPNWQTGANNLTFLLLLSSSIKCEQYICHNKISDCEEKIRWYLGKFLCDINSQESITTALASSWQRLASDIGELFFAVYCGSFLSYSLKHPLFLSRQTDLQSRQRCPLCCNHPTCQLPERRGTPGLSRSPGELLDCSWGAAGLQEGFPFPLSPPWALLSSCLIHVDW